MAKVTLTVFETSNEKESGTVRFKLENGICVQKTCLKKEYFERGVGVAAQVVVIKDGDRLVKKFFQVAGIPAKRKKAALK